MIRIEGVSKRYGAEVVLSPTTLDVAARTTVAVIGPSGCGKSTLLRIVVGLVSPDAGRVAIDGEEMTPASAERLRARIGYVIQDGGLFPHLSAADNVALVARHLRWDEPRIAARLGELAALVQLEERILARYPAELSGGQRQRVGLMRALMLDPKVLLLDEPMGALDAIVRSQLQEDLRAIFRRLGKAALLVTHDLAEAAFLADDVAVMNAGKIVQRGTMRELVDRPADPFVTRLVSAQRPVL